MYLCVLMYAYIPTTRVRVCVYSNLCPLQGEPSCWAATDLPSREEGQEERDLYFNIQAKPRKMKAPSIEELRMPSVELVRKLAASRGAKCDWKATLRK